MNNKIKLIFDLDGVALAILPVNYRLHLFNYPHLLLYFMRNTAFFYSTCSHPVPQCVLTGFVELLQYLHSPEISQFVEIAFFSAGLETRNKDFLRALYKIALGDTLARQVLPTIKLCSRDHCAPPLVEEVKIQRQLFGIETHPSFYKKNIFLLVEPADAANTLMIDDHPEISCLNQVKNYCAVQSVSLDAFIYALARTEKCDSANTPLFQKLNSIFYLAGLLEECFAHFHIEKNKPKTENRIGITDKLFSLQFAQNQSLYLKGGIKHYHPQFETNFANQAFYDRGKRILQKYNPSLAFVTPTEIDSFTQKPPTEEEQKHLTKLFFSLPYQHRVEASPSPLPPSPCFRLASARPRPQNHHQDHHHALPTESSRSQSTKKPIPAHQKTESLPQASSNNLANSPYLRSVSARPKSTFGLRVPQVTVTSKSDEEAPSSNPTNALQHRKFMR